MIKSGNILNSDPENRVGYRVLHFNIKELVNLLRGVTLKDLIPLTWCRPEGPIYCLHGVASKDQSITVVTVSL